MVLEIERALESWCAPGRRCIGQILIERSRDDLFVLCHRDDDGRDGLNVLREANDVADLAKFDDAGNYRPLKTAPNLRHGWRMELRDVGQLRRALDLFYPGRIAMLLAFEQKKLRTTSLRETLERQTGMYRIAAKISDDAIDLVVGNFCRSDGGCLRTIVWKRDETGALASTRLPPAKFDVGFDRASTAIPLLCQEACNLLVNAAREAVKGET